MTYFMSYRLLQALYKKCPASCCVHKNYYSLLRPTSVTFVSNSLYHREINETVQKRMKSQDKITDPYRLIYRAPLKNYVKFTYYTAFTSLAMMVPFIGTCVYTSGLDQFPIVLYNTEVIQGVGEFWGLVAGIGLMTLQVFIVVLKYPLRIYKNCEKKHYIAVFQHLLPWKHKKECFSGEVRKSATSMPWKESLFVLNNKKVIILEDYFTKPSDFNEMLHSDENHLSN